MSVASDFEARVAQASEAAADQRWGPAGAEWDRAAAMAVRHGVHASAVACFEQAGECWRRADRLDAATAALEGALSQPVAPSDIGAVQARLAALLGERGRGREALAMAREAVRTASGPTRALAIDTHIGLLQGFGRKREQRPLVSELEGLLGAGAPAVGFRVGQLRQLDGDLQGARQAFAAVRQTMQGVPGAEAGVAAAEMEGAEVDMLQAAIAEAIDAFARGRALHEVAGRISLMWRCEVGRVRASVEAGVPVLASGLDAARHWAVEGGMDLLAVDLTMAQGLAAVGRDPQHARAALLEAALAADRMGARSRAGRLRLYLGSLEIPAVVDERRRWLMEAEGLLSDNLPLQDRARTAVAALGPPSR